MRIPLLSLCFVSYGFAQVTVLTLAQVKLQSRLERYEGKNEVRGDTLKSLFEEAGCAGEWLTAQGIKSNPRPNVICTLKGQQENVIVVGAHYDKTYDGDGVVDNWSGAGLLPSLYESLAGKPRRHTFVFVGFTDEEKGLVGSEYYVKSLKPEDLARTRAMVNIDSVGLSSTKIWTSRADKALLDYLFRAAAALNLPVDGIDVDKVGDSDSHPFARRKIPVIDFHSITQDTLRILHSRYDKLSAISRDDYYATYRLISVYLAYLDSKLDAGD